MYLHHLPADANAVVFRGIVYSKVWTAISVLHLQNKIYILWRHRNLQGVIYYWQDQTATVMVRRNVRTTGNKAIVVILRLSTLNARRHAALAKVIYKTGILNLNNIWFLSFFLVELFWSYFGIDRNAKWSYIPGVDNYNAIPSKFEWN